MPRMSGDCSVHRGQNVEALDFMYWQNMDIRQTTEYFIWPMITIDDPACHKPTNHRLCLESCRAPLHIVASTNRNERRLAIVEPGPEKFLIEAFLFAPLAENQSGD